MRRSRKQWRDLTTTQRMRIVLIGTIQLVLLAAALADIRRRAEAEIKGGKRLWTAIAFVNGIGPIAYFAFGRRRAGGEAPERPAA